MSKPLSGPGPACGLSHFSHVQLFAMLWTVTHRDPLSMGILQARILEWVAIPPPGDLPDPGIEPVSPVSPAFAGRFFTTSATWKALLYLHLYLYLHLIYIHTCPFFYTI